MTRKVKFFMDTNFLLIPEKFGADIFGEIEEKFPGAGLATVSPVVDELEKMHKKLALGMIKKFGVEVVAEKGDADSALLRAATRERGAVCTNDIGLKKRCLEMKIPVIFLRKKRILEIKGGFNV